MNTIEKEANAKAASVPPPVSTAAKGASATLVRDQASVSIIARGNIVSIAAEQASSSFVAHAAGAKTVLMGPTRHHDVKSGCKRCGMHAGCSGQAWSKWWTSSWAGSVWACVGDRDIRGHTKGKVNVEKLV